MAVFAQVSYNSKWISPKKSVNGRATNTPFVPSNTGGCQDALYYHDSDSRTICNRSGGAIMSITKKLRFEVFKRDSFTCQYCGKSAPDVTLQVDHIHPKSKGGTDDLLNLITSCFDCNQGKKDRLLSDDTVIQKRKRQLDELQERREQLEMLMDWQKGLMDLDTDIISGLHDLWRQLAPGFSLSPTGLDSLKKWTKRWDLMEIADAMRVSTDQYLRYEEVTEGESHPTAESVQKAFSYVPRIIGNKKTMAEKPYLKELYYIRGILKNRLNYCNPQKALEYLEQAYAADVPYSDMTELAKTCRNWTQFVSGIAALINGEENENEE